MIIKGEDCLLCVDCNDKDYIFPLVAICQEKDANKLNAAILEWDNKNKKEYKQKLRERVINVFYKDNSTLLRRIEEFYGISIHDEFLKYDL